MTLVLECIDRWKRVITLTEDCWFNHVLVNHPDIEAMYERLHLVIEDPQVVSHDAFHEDRESFYRRDINRGRPNSIVKMSVKFFRPEADGSVRGDIRSIHETDRLKQGERRKWQR